MGDNLLNFYAGAPPLNRLSFHRNSTEKMTAHLNDTSGKFIIFKDGKPLMKLSSTTKDSQQGWSNPSSTGTHSQLYISTRQQIDPLLLGGFANPSEIKEGRNGKVTGKYLESARLNVEGVESVAEKEGLPTLVFLGIDDRSSEEKGKDGEAEVGEKYGSTSQDGKQPQSQPNDEEMKTDVLESNDPQNPSGTPYWAIDVSSPLLASQLLPSFLSSISPSSSSTSTSSSPAAAAFQDARTAASTLSPFYANIFATARALVDWNDRNRFCTGCGKRTYGLWGGWKRVCEGALEGGEGGCKTLKGVQNTSYPRTDPVIIMAILDETGERVLLGRQKAWPKGMYSCLAGFIEPGETFEDAVRREVLEEAGIVVGDVRYCSSQPWPYPSNLMVGCFGQVQNSKSQTINLTLDNELEDARWFTRSEIQKILSSKDGTNISSHRPGGGESEAKKSLDAANALAPSEGAVTSSEKDEGEKKVEIRVPPVTAIAGVLIKHWANGGIDATGGLKASL